MRRRFRAHYGTTPGICAFLWPRLEVFSLSPKPEYFHLLWALLFLKLYDTEEVLAGMVGGVDEKTYRK